FRQWPQMNSWVERDKPEATASSGGSDPSAVRTDGKTEDRSIVAAQLVRKREPGAIFQVPQTRRRIRSARVSITAPARRHHPRAVRAECGRSSWHGMSR